MFLLDYMDTKQKVRWRSTKNYNTYNDNEQKQSNDLE